MRKIVIILSFFTLIASSCGQTAKNKEPILNVADEGVIINGVKWATRNVDSPHTFAESPEDVGMFYQWNKKIGWSAANPIVNSNNKTEWKDAISTDKIWIARNDPSPDGWRVPTMEEIYSLLDTEKVTNEWTVQNGVNGRRFTDIVTGNFIFLPAAGGRLGDDGCLYNVSLSGNYWSNKKLNSDHGHFAYSLLFFRDRGAKWEEFHICGMGFSIRCVAK